MTDQDHLSRTQVRIVTRQSFTGPPTPPHLIHPSYFNEQMSGFVYVGMTPTGDEFEHDYESKRSTP